MSDQWQTSCMSCFADCGVCWSGHCSPTGVQSEAVHRVTDSGTCVPCLLDTFLCCIGRCINRQKFIKAVGIKPNFWYDCLLSWFFPCCAAIQEYNEAFSVRAKP